MIVNTAAELAQYIKNSKKYENYYMGQCVLHDDKHPSFKFWDGEDGRPAGYCLACGGKIRAAFDKLGLEYPSAKGKYTPEAIKYRYYNELGSYIGTKVVSHKPDGSKKIHWEIESQNGQVIYKQPKGELLLFNLPNLANTPEGKTVYVAEGEKDATTITNHGMLAVSAPNGAGPGKFPVPAAKYFAGKHVIIYQDNDKIGKDFAQEEAALISTVAASVKVIDLSEIWEDMPEHADITDYIKRFGDNAFNEVKKLVEKTPVWTASKTATETELQGLQIRSAKDLMLQHFEPVPFTVNCILPTGLSLMASPPKSGKSWFSLELCLSVSKGETFLGLGTTQSDVLYLDLEDGDAELKERIKKVNRGEDVPDGFMYLTEVPTMDNGLVEMLEKTLAEHPTIKLVVLDTLGMVLGTQTKDSNQFAQDYEMFRTLKQVATKYSISLLVIHHTRKTSDDKNPFNRIYGGVAVQGALDTMMVLDKDTHDADTARLYVSGRRCRQQEFVLAFDADNCIWSMVGDAEEVDEKFRRGQYERSEVASAIKEAVASGNGTWSGRMSDLSRVAENTPDIGHGLGNPRSLASAVKRLEDDLYRYDGISYTTTPNGTGGQKYTFTQANSKGLEKWVETDVSFEDVKVSN